ncbi:hypothetical protein [Baekduia sp. Peel2402]|uniref:hypothetical protein n=1 Tax=Baekduia sp. Peel2402 TaxID=3458296 RepID=UPI00403E4338
MLAVLLPFATAGGARGETLDLSPAAASACPARATPTGGAEVVNLYATLAPQDASVTAADGAPPPAEGYAHAAERMTEDAESLDELLATGDRAAADGVAQGLMHGLVASGAVPTAGALCFESPVACGVLIVGTAAVFYIFGPKPMSVTVDGGDSDGLAISDAWWQYNTNDQHIFDWTRGPFVGAGEWYMVYSTGGGNWSWMHHGSPDNCNFGPPAPRSVIVRDGLGNICVADLPIQAYVRTDEMMTTARHPPKHVDSPPPGSTSVNPPPTPSRSTMADAAADALNGNPTLAAWINYELGVPGAEDPITGKVIVPNCDGLTWVQCRDQMTGFGFATPVRIEIADEATALAPDVSAGRVALVEGEKTGRDPDDVLGVTVMPETLMSPRTHPIPDVDTLVETEAEITTEDSGVCDLSSALPATGPVSDATTFDSYPSLLGAPVTYPVDTSSALLLPGSTEARADETVLRVGAVRANSSGFGWRHVVARHGWTAKDEVLTRLTLASQHHAIDRVSTNQGFLDTYYADVASGAWYYHRTPTRIITCARRVVVKPDRLVSNSWGSVPQPVDGVLPSQTGVWTSYGKAIGEGVLP